MINDLRQQASQPSVFLHLCEQRVREINELISTHQEKIEVCKQAIGINQLSILTESDLPELAEYAKIAKQYEEKLSSVFVAIRQHFINFQDHCDRQTVKITILESYNQIYQLYAKECQQLIYSAFNLQWLQSYWNEHELNLDKINIKQNTHESWDEDFELPSHGKLIFSPPSKVNCCWLSEESSTDEDTLHRESVNNMLNELESDTRTHEPKPVSILEKNKIVL